EETPKLEGTAIKGRLKRIQEEVQHNLAILKDQGEDQGVHTLYHLNAAPKQEESMAFEVVWANHHHEGLSPKSKYIIDTMNEHREKLDLVGKGLDVVQKDTQSTNDKDGVEGGNYSDRNRSSWSYKEERHERHERNRQEERGGRHERCDRREEDRRDELDMSKCKIPTFLRNCKPEFYIDWELKVEQESKSMEEYHKEMKMDLFRAQLRESKEATMAIFLHELNREIQDVVELQNYVTNNVIDTLPNH
ncbi:hypothetical protein CR513_19030, partial [Mucuna pruriens]